jgi:hypothetical protein
MINGGLVAREVKGSISHAMLKKFVDEGESQGDSPLQESSLMEHMNKSKASIWTSMISPQNNLV